MRITMHISLFCAACVIFWLIYAVIPTYAMKAARWIKRHDVSGAAATDKPVIALTFDDGPSPHYTATLLDMLHDNHVRATFFVVGVFAQDNPDLIKRMQNEGHIIGIHSFAHENGLFMSPNKTIKDVARTIDALQQLDVKVRWYRPPWGHFNLAMFLCSKKFGIKPFLWDVMAQDWSAHTTIKTIEEKLIRRTKPGSVICLHDGRGRARAPQRTLGALRAVIPAWKKNGLTFVTADDYDCR